MSMFTVSLASPLAWIIFSESWEGYTRQKKADQLRELLVMCAGRSPREVNNMGLYSLELEAKRRGLL